MQQNIAKGKDIAVEITGWTGTSSNGEVTFKTDLEGIVVDIRAGGSTVTATTAKVAYKKVIVTLKTGGDTPANIIDAINADDGTGLKFWEISTSGSSNITAAEVINCDTAVTEAIAGIREAQFTYIGEPADVTTGNNNAARTFLDETGVTGCDIATNDLILSSMNHLWRFIKAAINHQSLHIKFTAGEHTTDTLVHEGLWRSNASPNFQYEQHVPVSITFMSDGKLTLTKTPNDA